MIMADVDMPNHNIIGSPNQISKSGSNDNQQDGACEVNFSFRNNLTLLKSLDVQKHELVIIIQRPSDMST